MNAITPKREIPVPCFEFAMARTGAVKLKFTGRHRVDDGAVLRIEGNDVLVDRGAYPPLRFSGLSDLDLRRLAAADSISVCRSFPGGGDFTTTVWLDGADPALATPIDSDAPPPPPVL